MGRAQGYRPIATYEGGQANVGLPKSIGATSSRGPPYREPRLQPESAGIVSPPATRAGMAVRRLSQASYAKMSRDRRRLRPSHRVLALDVTGPLVQRDLALTLEKSSVSRLVDGLARRGLVERNPHPEDGRQLQVGLTEAGRLRSRRFGRRAQHGWQDCSPPSPPTSGTLSSPGLESPTPPTTLTWSPPCMSGLTLNSPITAPTPSLAE